MADYKELSNSLYQSLINKGSVEFFSLFENAFKGIYLSLRVLDEHEEGMTSAELAREINISTARVAVMMKTLRRKGFVSKLKRKRGQDRRCTIIVITPEGRKSLEERKKLVSEYIERKLVALEEKEAEEFVYLYRKLFE